MVILSGFIKYLTCLYMYIFKHICKNKERGMKKHLKHPIFKIIAGIAAENQMQAYVIGGFVRDIFLNRRSKDIDIVVVGSGIELAKAVSKKIGNTNISIFKNYGTAMLKYKDIEVEFVRARRESYSEESRNPVVEVGSLEDDQNRRDFTINALALSLCPENFGTLVDPFNGIEDLKNKIIRTPLEPEKTFSDDPLRMMRAIRFAAQLDFQIHNDTFQAIAAHAERIKIISRERINDELHKIVLSKKPSIGFNLLDKCDLLKIVLPFLHNLKGVEEKQGKKHKDNFYHTIEVLDNIALNTNNLWLRWAAIFHDIAKPHTKRFSETGWTFHGHEFYGSHMIPTEFKELKFPLNEKMKYVKKLVLLHLRPIILSSDEVTDSAVRRLLFDAGDDIEDLMILCEADITSKIEEKKKLYLANFQLVRQKMKELEEKDAIRNFQPPITGDEIVKAFDLPPCRTIGDLKNLIKEAILDGIIQNNREEAIDFLIKQAEKMNLTVKNPEVFGSVTD